MESPHPHRFRDRLDAGRQLGLELAAFFGAPEPPDQTQPTPGPPAAPGLLILGLPRGGVPVAAQVAEVLAAPLDVVPVRKIGLPAQPELAAGALASVAGHVTMIRNEDILRLWKDHDSSADLEFREAAAAQALELERRETLYRRGRAPLDVRGRTVVVADDGLATGATMGAALTALRRQSPARLVAAAPVSCGTAGDAAAALADDVVIPWAHSSLSSVGQAYDSFDQVSDAEVQQLLRSS